MTDSKIPAVLGWTPGRVKRSRMFVLLLVACAGAGLFATLALPWYSWATTGQAACERPTAVTEVSVRTDASGTLTEGVYASGCVSGRELVAQTSAETDPQLASAYASLSRVGTAPPPASLFGVPRTSALMVLACAAAALALLARNGFIAVAALAMMWLAHRDLGSLRSTLLSGDGGLLTRTESGSSLFAASLLMAWGLAAVATVFVLRANADERKVGAAQARAEGRPEPMSPMDHMAGFVGRAAAKAVAAANEERERKDSPATR